MDMKYGISNYDRERGNFPHLPVVNMFTETVPIEETQSVLQSRPGLANNAISMGAGEIRALFQVDGVLDNGLFGLAGTGFYSSGTLIGSVTGDGSASIDGYENFVFVNAGEGLYGYDGMTFSTVAVPDGADVIKVLVGAFRAIIIKKDTQTFLFSDPLTDTIDALSFASAENSPDRLRDALYIGDTLILFGAKTIEFWPSNDDDDAPFLPLKGRVFQTGIRGTGMAAGFKDTFVWVTEDNEVCVQTPDGVISDLGLSRRIADSETVKVWTFFLDSIEFICVSLDDEDNVFCSKTGTWSVFESYNQTGWLPQFYANGVFGSKVSGQLYEWSEDHQDFGGVLERRFRSWMPINSNNVKINNIILRTNPGQTPFSTGDYDDPVIELRLSKDGGFTFNNWRSRQLGQIGHYSIQVTWSSLGLYHQPGILAEFRVTDPVPFRVSNVLVNEPFGARNGV